jgi:tricorn protease
MLCEGNTPQWSPSGEEILFEFRKSWTEAPIIGTYPAPETFPEVSPVHFIAETEIDRKEEIKSVALEAWTHIYTSFYDTLFHGVDWAKIKSKYAPLVEQAENQHEICGIIDRMLGELKSSHIGIAPPGWMEQWEHKPASPGFQIVEENHHFVIKNVLKGTPADSAGIEEDFRVFEIDGARLEPGENPYKEVMGKEEIEILAGKSKREARKYRFRSLSAKSYQEKVLGNWALERNRIVEEKGNGRLGYIYLSRMDDDNLNKFRDSIKELKDKEALIIDVRYNPGGGIHEQLMDILVKSPLVQYQPRGQERRTQPDLYWGKPLVLLINERSGSDSELFSQCFKEAGIGKVIGVPTGGGVISTPRVTLSDGSTLFVPSAGFYTLDGKNLEGLGIKPDIWVEETSKDRAEGLDPQLEKAIEILLDTVGVRLESGK